MTEKKIRSGRVSVSTWLTPGDVERLNFHVKRIAENLHDEYPGAKLTRHALVQKIIIEWLDAEEEEK